MSHQCFLFILKKYLLHFVSSLSFLDTSEKHICIAPELPALFIVEDQANLSTLHQAQRGRRIEKGGGDDEEEEEEEEEERGKGWKCTVM